MMDFRNQNVYCCFYGILFKYKTLGRNQCFNHPGGISVYDFSSFFSILNDLHTN